MRGYKLAGVIMAGLLLFPWQVRGEDLTAVETEGTAMIEEDSIIIPEEEIYLRVNLDNPASLAGQSG